MEIRYGDRKCSTIKGDNMVMYIAELNLIKIAFPDPMHVLYENLFRKRVGSVLFNSEFLPPSQTERELLNGKIE